METMTCYDPNSEEVQMRNYNMSEGEQWMYAVMMVLIYGTSAAIVIALTLWALGVL
jgi:hypothetical protein